MTERDRVRFGNTTIEYEVRRSDRRKKTVQITVDGNGVQVAAPATTPGDDVKAIVRKRGPWILRHSTGKTLVAVPKRFVSGETLLYLGRNVRMVVETTDARSPDVRFDHWSFRVTVPPGLAGDARRDAIRRALVAWYRVRAAERLSAGVARWWPHVGQGKPLQILIRDQRQRWASCAPDGTLRFNWRVVMAAPALVDYVVVHELAHLSIKAHSREFWQLVARVLPDADARRRRLKELGRYLSL